MKSSVIAGLLVAVQSFTVTLTSPGYPQDYALDVLVASQHQPFEHSDKPYPNLTIPPKPYGYNAKDE